MKQAKQGRAFTPQDHIELITPEQAATLRARRRNFAERWKPQPAEQWK